MRLSTLLLPLLAALPLSSAVSTGTHTSNWAVLVGTSRFWFNYRHIANVLSVYRTVKRLGIPDSQIILMLSDDVACNPRNLFPGTVYNNVDRALDLYGDNIEVDYRGYEVTVENFIRLLTDRVDPETPRSKRLLSDDRSNVLIYMTGHGGNEFLKFQDAEELGAWDIADAVEQMWEKKRYNELLFMIDTCQANTMYSKFYSPNVLATGSSKLDESSLSHHADSDVGVAVIDRFTYYNLEYLEKNVQNISSQHTMKELFDSYDPAQIQSTPGVRTDLFRRDLSEVLITDFFGSVQRVEVEDGDAPVEDEWEGLRKLVENRLGCEAKNASKETPKEKEVKKEAEKAVNDKGRPFRVEEAKEGWSFTKKDMYGAGALAACLGVWVLGSSL